MNEGQWTQKLLKELRRRLPGAVIFKHADQYTAGVPDFSITLDGETTWFEVKLSTNKKIFEPLQEETLKKLVRGAYIVWYPVERKGDVFWAGHGYQFSPQYDFRQLLHHLISFLEEPK